MVDDAARIQANAELEAAKRQLEIAEAEFQAAIQRGAAPGNLGNIVTAQQALVNAKLSLQAAAAINMEIETDLMNAIRAIGDAADEDSLLRNPFNAEADIGQFVSPLTDADRETIASLRKRIEGELALIHKLKVQVAPIAPGAAQHQIDGANFRINSLQDGITKIMEKEIVARNEFNARVLAIRADISAQRGEIFDEFITSVDKFEDIFKNEGLDNILEKRTRPQFEKFARNFINDEPEILFVAEYVVEGQFAGSLLCFEKYKSSSHYEIFKNNVFKDPLSKTPGDGNFKRIFYLDSRNLRVETEKFIPYVRDILGFKDINFNKIFLFLDTDVKVDRIYEYSVAAAMVPVRAQDVDYDLVMEGKGLLNSTTLGQFSGVNLFSWCATLLGSEDLAWVLSLVNEGVVFFGRPTSEQSLNTIITDAPAVVGGVQFFVPRNINDVLDIIQESQSLLGVLPTFEHMTSVLGGLPTELLHAVKASVDESRNLFSFDQFRTALKNQSPVFQLVLEVAETEDVAALKRLSQMSIKLPMDTGSESITTVLGLSRVFKFMNDTLIALTYSQEQGSFEKIIEIRALIDVNREEEDPFLEGAQQTRDVVAGQTVNLDDGVSTQFSIDLGGRLNFSSDDDDAPFTIEGVSKA